MNQPSASLLLFAALASGCTVWKSDPTEGSDDSGTASMESPTTATPDDADGDGWPAETDCDDTNAEVNPDAGERCNGIDDDCNGAVDDSVGEDWYTDADADSYGKVFLEQACEGPEGAVSVDGDCNDEDPTVHPWSENLVDGQDSDCNGKKDWLVTIVHAVDDAGELCINDETLGATGGWVDGAVTELWLASGTHTIGIHGWDTGRVITAAIAHIGISDGSVWVTDGTWRYDPEPDQDGVGKMGWCGTGFDDSEWDLALDLGPIGDPANPWGPSPNLFPEGSPARWIWDHFPVDLNTQYLRSEFVLP